MIPLKDVNPTRRPAVLTIALIVVCVLVFAYQQTKTDDPLEAVAGARALYTDTWVSMGDEDTREQRLRDLDPYRIDDDLMDRAAGDAVALHGLPAHAGEEITYEVLHGPRSAGWDQAENRMHAQASLLAHVLAGP